MLHLPIIKCHSLCWILGLFLSAKVQAQFNGAFQFSSIGYTNSRQPIFSGPIAVNAKLCLQLTNGIKTFSTDLGQGIFNIECKVPSERPLIELKAYPIPTTGWLTVKSVAPIKAGVETNKVQLNLYDGMGRLVESIGTSIEQLNDGLQMNLQKQAAGAYLLEVLQNEQFIQTVKIIKYN